MTKSTHLGHCQACGALQALPNGRLSIHGYTVAHGFFSGRCMGERHLPFEQSKDLIDLTIERATERAAELRAEAAETRASTDPAKAWVHIRIAPTWKNRRGGWTWEQKTVAISPTKFMSEGTYAYYVNATGQKRPVADGVGYTDAEPADRLTHAVAYLNDRRAKYLENLAAQADAYVALQRARVKNWKPQPLIAREAV